MLAAMERAGAVRLSAREIDALTKVAIASVGEGAHKHDVPAKDFIGKDAAVLARGIGKTRARPTSSCSSARPTNRTPSCPSSR